VRDRRFWRWLIYFPLFVPAIGGCQLFQPAPVPILVRDAETKAPLPNASVSLHPLTDENGAPQQQTTTGADGIARVAIDRKHASEWIVGVSAEGYMNGDLTLAAATRVIDNQTGGGVIEVFSGPRPVAILVIPDDYRGPIRTQMRPSDDRSPLIGQRTFEFIVPPSGSVDLVGPPVLRRWPGPDFHARYANGTALPLNPTDKEVALRWLKSSGPEEFFVVGTKADWVKTLGGAVPMSSGSTSTPTKPSGGKGGRRGGGGGGGGGGGSGSGSVSSW